MLALPSPVPTPSGVDNIDVGNGWSLAAVLALIAAFVAAATLGWTILSYFWTRRRLSKFESASLVAQDREEFRVQRDNAINLMLGPGSEHKLVGLTMLQDLRTHPLATDRDRFTIAIVLNAVVGGGTI